MLAKSKIFFLLTFSIIFNSISAQIIVPSSDSLNFGNVFVGDKDSIQLTLTNISSQNIQVTNVKFYTIYSNFPFSASSTSFAIPALGSSSIWIYFEPEHNILNNSELVVQHNANSGAESIDIRGQGVFSNAYYNVTQNLEEQALKNALNTRLAQGYSQQSYNAARDAMFMTIDNKRLNGQAASVNTLECVYTGYNKTSYTSRSDAQTTNPQFNTEHTFPQGFFNQALPMRTDLHHLFPTTNNSNSQRGSKSFGVVTNGTPVTLGGGSFYNTTTFEPRNAQKGKTARAMMYFVIRYQDYQNHFSVQENILRSWHNSYPPDSIESRRNDDVFAVQNNRNPFIDYPQLEERITNFVSNSVAPVLNGIDILQTSIDFGTFLNQQADTFDYVLVNRGNQPITFSNFTLTNSNILSFSGSFGGSLQIAPGDALIIPVIVQTANSTTIVESLTFSTSLPGSQSSYTIPIRGQSVITALNENRLEDELSIYPNPFDDVLNISHLSNQAIEFSIADSKGSMVYPLTKTAGKSRLDMSNFSKGVYFLEVISASGSKVYKLIK